MQISVGDIVRGKVTGVAKFGVFVLLETNQNALVHISELSDCYVKDIASLYNVGDDIEAVVIDIDDNGKVYLSVKSFSRNKLKLKGPDEIIEHKNKPLSFEEMMSKFKQDSEQKTHDLKKYYEGKRGAPTKRR